MSYTVCKFQDFFVIQILCEINFVNSRSSKTVIFAILEALNLDHDEFLQFLKAEIYQISKFRAPKIAKNGSFATSRMSKIDFT